MKQSESGKESSFLNNIVMLVILGMMIVSTVDTDLFVYPSLSRALLSEILITALFFCILCHSIYRQKYIIGSRGEALMFAWIIYIGLHYAISRPHEQYRTQYLCLSLVLLITVAYGIRNKIILRRHCENTLLSITCLHMLYLAAQAIGLSHSGNEFFPLTGSNENPTATAVYLAATVPLIIKRLIQTKKKLFPSLFLSVTLISIAILQCRTAYIGIIAEGVILLLVYARRKNVFTIKSKIINKVVVFSLIISATVASGFGMYHMKKDSADGRMIVWKLSADMILNNPLGYGYGLFDKFYNLHQAEHFEKDACSETEKRNAAYVPVPYNDYLEHGVEGGVAGMVFLASFYTLIIKRTFKGKHYCDAAIATAFAVMSLTNFVYTSIQPWYLLMIIAAFHINRQEKQERNPSMPLLRFANGGIAIAVLITSYFTINASRGQRRLKQIETTINTSRYSVDDNRYAEIEESIGTSEAYWRSRANNNIANGEYGKATLNLQNAACYSSTPSVFFMLYMCSKYEGETDKAMNYLMMVHLIQPYMMRPMLILMNEYALSDMDRAMYFANVIRMTNPKINNEASREIKKEALEFLSRHNP